MIQENSEKVRAAWLLHPVALSALAILALNDHWLKFAHPGVVSGKLSDFCGLAVFPLFLISLMELVSGRETSRSADIAAITLTGALFAAVKTIPLATTFYETIWGLAWWPFSVVSSLLSKRDIPHWRPAHLVRDTSDLSALVALTVPWWITRARRQVRT